ncbi:MAG TPA: putative glycolipid-binding domain-containing protein [Candidatus Limnocylindrales bacterium]|nr:putative glycolipid-binding domain-containing protein [Candidatus Limnocylindrales bacterium]
MEIVWESLEWPGMEHVIWEGGHADSVAVLLPPEGPQRVSYRITPTRVEINGLILEHDGEGSWRDRPELDGCLEVDISITPLTNTLPINRLKLRPGESREIRAAYIELPGLTVSVMPQRYTCLGDRLYRYQSEGFQADLTVDEHGLVVDYPGLWRRLHAG